MLLERAEVISENLDNGGRTPLSYAAHGGNEEVVKMLLGRQVLNLDTLVNNTQELLMFAPGYRYSYSRALALRQPTSRSRLTSWKSQRFLPFWILLLGEVILGIKIL